MYALAQVYDKLHGMKNSRVLDIGCGSGYLTAAFHEMVSFIRMLFTFLGGQWIDHHWH